MWGKSLCGVAVWLSLSLSVVVRGWLGVSDKSIGLLVWRPDWSLGGGPGWCWLVLPPKFWGPRGTAEPGRGVPVQGA